MKGPKPFELKPGEDARRSAPHVARNAGPIVEILRKILPERGLVLELASGSGEHAVHFARAFPDLTVQPSDPDPVARVSIEAWRLSEKLPNLLPALGLDAAQDSWRLDERPDAILCINMVHISAWTATQGLLRNAAEALSQGAPLYLYGPYRQHGVETAPSNEAFDLSLKSRNPEWGLRNVEDVAAEAARHGLTLESLFPMPANNLSLIFRRT